MPDLAISVSDLSKKYESGFAVSHTNFQVPAGTICGFVGPNGAGKTTTIRMLLGLITPTGGAGEILGQPITSPEKYLSQVGAMIEGPAFYPALSGAENLRVLATLGGFPIDRVQTLLEQVGLGDRAKSKFKTYSLGMKQRLGILKLASFAFSVAMTPSLVRLAPDLSVTSATPTSPKSG